MRIPRSLAPQLSRATRRYSSKPTRLTRPSPPPPFPTTPVCPPQTCTCAPTPSLDIDTTSPLNGAITAYHEQILICTGRDDWASRIEEENDGDNLAGTLKRDFLGRGGTLSDPFWNVSVLNSSFESETQGDTSVYLVPSFKYIPRLRKGQKEDIHNMLKGWVLPEKLSPMYDKTPEMKPAEPERFLRDEKARELLEGVRDVDEVLVLICGHGGRDERCGIYGPLLRGEFEEKLEAVGGLTVQKGAKHINATSNTTARVGLISHIGGHKFAGNVIIYIPPGAQLSSGEKHPLAGMGVWYGRVEPRHVEGIVRETVGAGRVIEELYRGAIDGGRRIVRIDVGEGVKS